jgi:hypothetical protein
MPCANCSAELVGEYCHACGQRALEDDDLAFGPLVRHVAHELVHLDFKTLHSLRGLLNPGFLTKEYLEGRRRRYLTPLKLYFVAAALFFLAAPFVGFSTFEMLQNDSRGVMKELVTARAQERGIGMALFAERFNVRIQTVLTVSYGISVFVTAFLLRALFRNHGLGVHLIFGLHYVSFLYLAAIALSTVQKQFSLQSGPATIALTYAVIAPYLFFGLRRVYQNSATRTMAKLLVLILITFVVDNAVSLGALLLTLWLV